MMALCLTLAGCGNREPGPAFSYDGQELQLRLANGEHVTLQNGKCDKGFDGCIVHRFKGTIANDQFYLVDIGYYEGGHHKLYSYKSGTGTVIYGQPHLSFQEKLIATAVSDEMNDGSGVYLFEIANGEAKEIFRYKPKGYGLYRFDRWKGESEAIIELTTMCRMDGKNEQLVTPVRLVNTPDGWQLDQGQGEACIASTYHPKS
ncbi:MAG: hypothetical protein DI582_10625 [Azospirillum brasilense]|nr:MAG: hypothetical protein DI582_10625 [Azospirillum brasilense]